MTDQFLVRHGYPPGVPCWVDTAQPDAEAAARFYGALFGWELEDQMPPEAPGRYFAARLHGHDVAAIGTQPDPAETTAVWQTYIGVEDVAASAAEVEDAGGAVLAAPFDVFAAGRMAVCADPTGAVFNLWQAGEHRGAALVNYPNTWNWSDLDTSDAEAAARFYRTVFGWEARTMGEGEAAFTMWCMPGYGDHLAEIEPSIRERQASEGAPEGFADAIAGLNETTGDVPSRWRVTFTVEDPDATAKLAQELGGQVVVEPFDAGPVRMAVLADPQGASFSVLRYSPG